METLLTIITFTLIMISIGLAFLYKCNSDEIKELSRAIRDLSAENTHIKAKQRVFEKRFIKMSEPADKIEILHKYDDSEAPKFGGF